MKMNPTEAAQRIDHLLDTKAELASICHKVVANTAKWGMQPVADIILAIQEEAGEIAQAYLQHVHEGGPLDRVSHEARDLAPLCLQLIVAVQNLRLEPKATAAPQPEPSGQRDNCFRCGAPLEGFPLPNPITQCTGTELCPRCYHLATVLQQGGKAPERFPDDDHDTNSPF